MVKKSDSILYVTIGVLLLAVDQVSKILLRNADYDFGFIAIRGTANTGISFGLLPDTSWIIAIVSVVALVLLYVYRKEFENYKIFYTLIIVGIIGNLVDRIIYWKVIDFIDLKWWPVFNIADSLIFIGVFGFIIFSLINNSKTQKLGKY